MQKAISIFCLLLLTACATQPVKNLDLSNGSSQKAVLSSECSAECILLVEKTFTYGKRIFHNGISSGILYEVNGVPGAHTFRCADCAGTIVNAFNDSWSGAYKVTIPAGATNLTVSVNDFRVRDKSKHRIEFQAIAGRNYALVQVQKNPLGNEDGWMPIVIDTVGNRIVTPLESNRWLRR